MKTGYYSKKLEKITEREVRLISLNSGSGDKYNAYVLASPSDPNHQIEFLTKELLELEKLNGYAYII